MKRYKVAIVSDFYFPQVGGLEVHMHDLAHELTLRGHEPHVICATPGGPNKEIFPVIRLDVPLMPIVKSIRNTETLPVLERALRAGGYDLVHAHNVFSPMAHAAAYLARKLDIPSVFTLHSVLRGAGSLVFRLIDQFCPWTQWPTVLTGVSSFVAEDLRAVSGRPDVHVLLNAVRTENWGESLCGGGAVGDTARELRVVSVLRFTKRKRPLDLIRMIPEVYKRLPESLRPKFTLIGDGPERPRVEREIRRLNLTAHVELTGLLPRAEIRKILARSAIFALPSYLEALPIAVLEARASGLPVVARTPNGVAEIIEHGKHGLLAKNTEEFIDALVLLSKEPALRAQMAAAAPRNLEHFTWDRCIASHERIYALAMESHFQGRLPNPAFRRKSVHLSPLQPNPLPPPMPIPRIGGQDM